MLRLTVAMALLASTLAVAQAPSVEQEIERYRALINDPFANPGTLSADRGEQLWGLPRGAADVALSACDLGEGPGVTEGASAHLPRYFADAGKVQDLEARLLWCMETLQKLDTADIRARRFAAPGKPSDMEDLTAFVAGKSNGMAIAPPQTHEKEREAFAVGEALFNRRAGPMDFSCATCHGDQGRRIRLQALPDLSKPGPEAQASAASWPAYRVSQNALRTMQHRLLDCYRQMRLPAPEYASDGVTALALYLARTGEGGRINVPDIKR